MKSSNDEWLQERKKGIGSSDISAILGIDEFKTPLDVFLDKTGRSEDHYSDTQLDDMDRGHWLEIPLIEWLSKETNKDFKHNTDIFINENPIFRCTPDAVFNDEIAEAKSTKLFQKDVSDKWFLQAQWQLGVTGFTYAYVVWLNGSLKRDYKEYKRDDELIDKMQFKALEFWNNHILKDEAPQATNTSDIKKLLKEAKEGKSYEANEFDYLSYERYVLLKNQIKDLQTSCENLEMEFKINMNDAEIMEYSGNKLFTWKNQTSYRFDSLNFRKDHPGIYAKYLKKSNNRVFLTKGLK